MGSILYALTCTASDENITRIRPCTELLVGLIDNAVHKETNPDFLGGLAGAVAALIAYTASSNDLKALAVADKCGDRLVKTALRSMGQASWAVGDSLALTGMAHGASGIAYALSLLYKATNSDCYRSLALEAVAFERTQYSSAVGNWADNRPWLIEKGADRWATVAWCAGAPGIGLARSRMQALLGADFTSEIRACVALTMKSIFTLSDASLCHGRFGNLDALLSISESHPDLVESESLKALYAKALADFQLSLISFAGGVDCMSFMQGLLGVPWALLRFSKPTSLPNVLLLERPNTKHRVSTEQNVKAKGHV